MVSSRSSIKNISYYNNESRKNHPGKKKIVVIYTVTVELSCSKHLCQESEHVCMTLGKTDSYHGESICILCIWGGGGGEREECGKVILHLRCVLLLVLEQHICISSFILLLLQAPNTWFDNPPDFPVDVAEIMK